MYVPQRAPNDTLGRPLRDLRISVTDRCNLRCRYCMPREQFGNDHSFLTRQQLLRFEEIHKVVRAASHLGLRRLRLTGGEPLLRRELPLLIAMLATTPDLEIALTTNGTLLPQQAQALADAGLRRVTVSLDSLDNDIFRTMTDSSGSVEDVLAGIEAARVAGLEPIKVNAVVRRGRNDHTALDLARHFKGTGITVRFIEYMDVGRTNQWALEEVVPSSELLGRLDAVFKLEPVEPEFPGEVARRYRYIDGDGEVGFISSVTQPFCGACTRMRLSSDGQLYTCLFAEKGTDLKGPLRDGLEEEALVALLADAWQSRTDRYSEQRAAMHPSTQPIEMSYIGG